MQKSPRLLTLTEAARIVGVAQARFWRLFRRGIIAADFTATGAILFRPQTVSELATRISFLESAALQL